MFWDQEAKFFKNIMPAVVLSDRRATLSIEPIGSDPLAKLQLKLLQQASVLLPIILAIERFQMDGDRLKIAAQRVELGASVGQAGNQRPAFRKEGEHRLQFGIGHHALQPDRLDQSTHRDNHDCIRSVKYVTVTNTGMSARRQRIRDLDAPGGGAVRSRPFLVSCDSPECKGNIRRIDGDGVGAGRGSHSPAPERRSRHRPTVIYPATIALSRTHG